MSAQAPGMRGFLGGWRWLLARRATQLSVIALFLAGPLFGVWLAKGNLASSVLFGVVPLSDPFVLLQSLAAGRWPLTEAFIGAGIVLVFYLLAGGRVFCAWVCPVNMVTDLAGWLRRRIGLKGGRAPHEATRRWLLIGVLLVAAITGALAWEWVNPVSLLFRGLLFGIGAGWLVIAAIFVYDLLVAQRGWCGHLCPMGAFYAQIGRFAALRVSAPLREHCDDCTDCFEVCPEPQVIRPALKRVGQTHAVILDGACTNCGRCIDVCGQNVFRLGPRKTQRSES